MNLEIFEKKGTNIMSDDYIINEQNEADSSMKTESEFS